MLGDSAPGGGYVRLGIFPDSPRLGGVAVTVWSVLYHWVFWGWSWHQAGETVAGPAHMACVACGRRGEGQEGWVWRSSRLLALRRGWGIYGIYI